MGVKGKLGGCSVGEGELNSEGVWGLTVHGFLNVIASNSPFFAVQSHKVCGVCVGRGWVKMERGRGGAFVVIQNRPPSLPP